jgi:hypothetical protein
MGPIASKLVLVFALIGAQVAPTLANDISTNAGKYADASLPAFVPPTGKSSYTIAVNENTSSAVAARRAAEVLSAKFSTSATGSISKDDPEPAPVLPAEADPPHVVAPSDDARTIVLSSTQSTNEKNAERSARPSRLKAAHVHRIPKSAFRKSSPTPPGKNAEDASLAQIGQKVSFLELLTNPALWFASTKTK